MPGARKLLGAFRLASVAVKHGFKMRVELAEEHVVRLNKEYNYNYKLIFLPKEDHANRRELIAAINNATRHGRIVSSQYGNPYSCTLHVSTVSRKGNGSIEVDLIGHSIKIGHANKQKDGKRNATTSHKPTKYSSSSSSAFSVPSSFSSSFSSSSHSDSDSDSSSSY